MEAKIRQGSAVAPLQPREVKTFSQDLSGNVRSVASFYKFVAIEHPATLVPSVRGLCESERVVGTVHLAQEGINATLAHDSRSVLQHLVDRIQSLRSFDGLEVKWSTAPAGQEVFLRLKVQLRKELVSLESGVVRVRPDKESKASAAQWDDLIRDPDSLLLDVRNAYEIGIGRFAGALDLSIESFGEFSEAAARKLHGLEHRTIAMYCTGGIRCEKAAAWMQEHGFESVVQLQGGILSYLAEKRGAPSRWEGECFVFDQRVSVDAHLRQGTHRQCHGCRHPVSAADALASKYKSGVSCPRCADLKTEIQKLRYRERVRQETAARARGGRHLGFRLPAPAAKSSGRRCTAPTLKSNVWRALTD